MKMDIHVGTPLRKGDGISSREMHYKVPRDIQVMRRASPTSPMMASDGPRRSQELYVLGC
jgi:hypothetical protein